MKYTVTVEINCPRDEMLEYFQDMTFMKVWQPNFQSLQVLEGQPGCVGSVSKLSYLEREKPSVIKETILHKALPDDFNFLYEAKGVVNYANNHFIDQGESCLWQATHTFEFKGLMKILNLFKKMFVKQTTSDMARFKAAIMEDKSSK